MMEILYTNIMKQIQLILEKRGRMGDGGYGENRCYFISPGNTLSDSTHLYHHRKHYWL
jgi:hypothetical protein